MREQLIQYVNLLFAGNGDVEDIKQEILQNTLDRYDDLIAQGKSVEEAYRQAIAGIGDVNDILKGKGNFSYTEANRYSEDNQSAGYAPIPEFEGTAPAVSRMMRAIAIFLYIVSPVPLFLFSIASWTEVGLCCLLVIVAAATALLILFKKSGAPLTMYRITRAAAVFLYIISPAPLFLFSIMNWAEVGLCFLLVIVAAATVLLILFKKPDDVNEYTQSSAQSARKDNPRKQLKKSIGSLISTVGTVMYFVISFATGAWFITWLIFPIIGAVKGVVNSCIDLKEDY